jgi:hypothetical protein
LTTPAAGCKKSSASEAPNPGRHHVGTPGDIISECPGDFVGIRSHGLSIPVLADPALSKKVEDLALKIAGENASPGAPVRNG